MTKTLKSLFVLLAFGFALPVARCVLFAQSTNGSFGRLQLEGLLRDRPELEEIVVGNEEIADWLIQRFEPKKSQRVYWDNNQPVSGQPAECNPGIYGRPTVVRVTATPLCPPTEKFASLILAFFHNDNGLARDDLIRDANAVKLSPEEFATAMNRLGFQAHLSAKQFLLRFDLFPEDSSNLPITHRIRHTPDEYIEYERYQDRLAEDGVIPNMTDIYRRLYDNLPSNSDLDDMNK